MRVLVTGGSGRLGQYVIRDLLEHGHEAVNIDKRRPSKDGVNVGRRVPYREVDLTNVGHVAGAMAGCDAVIHLGAIPAPYGHPDEVVFGNNTLATFAALQAAMLAGVRKAVVASSISALGMAYARKPFLPLYVPADEEHPLLGQDAYALSKEVDERTCEMFHRRTGMTVLAYRFHAILTHDEAISSAKWTRSRPEASSHQLWGYVDVLDAAAACRLGVESEGLGFETFNITAGDTLCDVPTMELVRRYLPNAETKSEIPGTESAWSIEKARRLLGYDPQHSWRDDGRT